MLKSLGQLRQQIAQECGIRNSLGDYDFDESTQPTLDQTNIYLNDTIRESCANWDYTFLETSKAYPFYHQISGVQGIDFTGTVSGIQVDGTVAPWPESVLAYSWRQSIQPNYNTSGFQFAGIGSNGLTYTTGISTTGVFSYNNSWTGIGYAYQLDSDIDKINALMISNSVGGSTGRVGPLAFVEWHDLERIIPIGIVSASGTPVYYTEFPGLSPNNNKSIQFFPTPLSGFYGESFIVHYKKKHVDLADDTDTQNVIPEQYQNVITYGTLEKIFDLLDNPKIALVTQRKENAITEMRIWDANQPNKMYQWRDFNYHNSSSRAYDNSDLIYPE